ncbi:MAG: hypothetical protein KAI29_31495, partial [Cyclobacteriaceae bacterium]|nr:hypothetical protein [Cyclobacteriaceae bacterium]
FIVGILWKRATPKAAEVTLLGGGAMSVFVGIAYFSDYPHARFWPNFLILSLYMFLILLVLMVTVSLLTKPVAEKALPPLGKSQVLSERKSTRLIWGLWLILAVIMVGLYILFN